MSENLIAVVGKYAAFIYEAFLISAVFLHWLVMLSVKSSAVD